MQCVFLGASNIPSDSDWGVDRIFGFPSLFRKRDYFMAHDIMVYRRRKFCESSGFGIAVFVVRADSQFLRTQIYGEKCRIISGIHVDRGVCGNLSFWI